jgi:hypothetical protein
MTENHGVASSILALGIFPSFQIQICVLSVASAGLIYGKAAIRVKGKLSRFAR